MDKTTHILTVAALTVVILVGGTWFVRNGPAVECWNFFGLSKGCQVTPSTK